SLRPSLTRPILRPVRLTSSFAAPGRGVLQRRDDLREAEADDPGAEPVAGDPAPPGPLGVVPEPQPCGRLRRRDQVVHRPYLRCPSRAKKKTTTSKIYPGCPGRRRRTRHYRARNERAAPCRTPPPAMRRQVIRAGRHRPREGSTRGPPKAPGLGEMRRM